MRGHLDECVSTALLGSNTAAIEPYCPAEAFMPILPEFCIPGYFGASCRADKSHRPVLKCRLGQQLSQLGRQRPQRAGVAWVVDGEVDG